MKVATGRASALDCATGNGQVARVLASYFERVCGIDISERQLHLAVARPNIAYLVSRAEQTPFGPDSFDLITVAQAYHWFDSQHFCREARRIARPDALVAVWSYNLPSCEPSLDSILRRWNYETLSPFWEAERQYLYTQYDSLTFDFERIPAPDFSIVAEWAKDDLVGYLRTWSALQKMLLEAGDTAFRQVIRNIDDAWGKEPTRQFTFPVFLRLGRVKK